MRMTSSPRIGQTLVGRTGISYHQQVLYERKQKDTGNEEVMHRLWLALYDPSNLQSLLVVKLFNRS